MAAPIASWRGLAPGRIRPPFPATTRQPSGPPTVPAPAACRTHHTPSSVCRPAAGVRKVRRRCAFRLPPALLLLPSSPPGQLPRFFALCRRGHQWQAPFPTVIVVQGLRRHRQWHGCPQSPCHAHQRLSRRGASGERVHQSTCSAPHLSGQAQPRPSCRRLSRAHRHLHSQAAYARELSWVSWVGYQQAVCWPPRPVDVQTCCMAACLPAHAFRCMQVVSTCKVLNSLCMGDISCTAITLIFALQPGARLTQQFPSICWRSHTSRPAALRTNSVVRAVR